MDSFDKKLLGIHQQQFAKMPEQQEQQQEQKFLEVYFGMTMTKAAEVVKKRKAALARAEKQMYLQLCELARINP